MPFVINGQVIKCKDDYLKKGSRERLNTTMRVDLKNDIITLSKYINEPISVLLDVFVLYLQDNPKVLDEFIDKCKKY